MSSKENASSLNSQPTGLLGVMASKAMSMTKNKKVKNAKSKTKTKAKAKTKTKTKTKTKKRETKKGKDKPKVRRAPSAYILYMKENRPSVVDAHPEVSFGEIARILGKQWKSLTANDKQQYVDASNALKSKSNEKSSDTEASSGATVEPKSARKRKAPSQPPPPADKQDNDESEADEEVDEAPSKKQPRLSMVDTDEIITAEIIAPPPPTLFSQEEFMSALREIMAPATTTEEVSDDVDWSAMESPKSEAQKLLDQAIEKHAVTRKEYDKLLAMKNEEILRLQQEIQSLHAARPDDQSQPSAAPASSSPQPPAEKAPDVGAKYMRVTKQLTGCSWTVDPTNPNLILCTGIYKPTKKAVTFTLESSADSPDQLLSMGTLIKYTPTGNQHLLPSFLRKVISFDSTQLPQLYSVVLSALVAP